jgi:hypothetical protein
MHGRAPNKKAGWAGQFRRSLTVHDCRQPLVADAHPRARPPDVDRPPAGGGWIIFSGLLYSDHRACMPLVIDRAHLPLHGVARVRVPADEDHGEVHGAHGEHQVEEAEAVGDVVLLLRRLPLRLLELRVRSFVRW